MWIPALKEMAGNPSLAVLPFSEELQHPVIECRKSLLEVEVEVGVEAAAVLKEDPKRRSYLINKWKRINGTGSVECPLAGHRASSALG